MRPRPILSIAATLALAAAAFAAGPATRPLKLDILVSRSTTYVDGPVNVDGTIDYVAYLNGEYARGVTPENNAAAPILLALGPAAARDQVRKYVPAGVASPPPAGKHFVSLRDYVTSGMGGVAGIPAEKREETFWSLDTVVQDVWRSKDHPLAAQWIEHNRPALDLLVSASGRPRFFMPVTVGANDWLLGARCLPTGLFADAVDTLHARARMKLGDDDVPGAVADLLACRRLGCLASNCPFLMTVLISMSIEDAATDELVRLATGGKLTGPQARALAAELAQPAPRADVGHALQTERLIALDAVMCIARAAAKGAPMQGAFNDRVKAEAIDQALRTGETVTLAKALAGRDFGLDWDLMLAIANTWHDRVETACRIENPAQRNRALADIRRRARQALDQDTARMQSAAREIVSSTTPNLKAREIISRQIGLLLVNTNWPRWGVVIDAQEKFLVRNDLARAAMALAACRAEKGAYPKALADLVPAYAKAIPLDRFSGKPLIYRPEGAGYILYSVGENGRDDGGKDDPKADDIVVRAR